MPESPTLDDRELIDAFVQGEPAAVRTIDSWIAAVLHSEFLSLRAEWDDLRQETRVRVFANLSRSRFVGRSSLRTYVHRIAKNVCIDASRLAWRHHEKPGAVDARRGPSTREASDQSIARDLVRKILHDLQDSDRQLISMVFHEHYSYSEVARKLGISEGAVKTRMSRCKDRLVAGGRRLLDGKGRVP
ncbi:MAG: RNA polymerase sigma factor [Acidobacteria bacterium]|nr:RNA polymerase sigma factor [Acidobacteriota bacterium]